jgi:succinate-semialdehyde dehydrogenase / glutarate-semialdehyde dehydrogenase
LTVSSSRRDDQAFPFRNLEDKVMALRDSSLLRQQCYLDGNWIDADNGAVAAINNPAIGRKLGTVPTLGTAETRRAIAAAEKAFPGWRALTAKQRSAILRRWFELCMANQEDLATIMTLEQGKPLAESRGEIAYGSAFIEWFAEEARRVYGDVIPANARDRRIMVLKEPIGVAAAITPWNFPNAMIARKAGAALAAGCTMVIKPAPATPFSALALAELAERAGVPKGVLNIITGDEIAIGRELCANPAVRKLSFTGSTEVGRILIEQSAPTIKKLSLELGGNAPFIIFDDAHLDQAVTGVMASKFRNAGQTCVCANRILVQDGIYDAFAARVRDAIGTLVVGDGVEEGVTIGPLIDAHALKKVEEHVADALSRGARLATGGKRHARGGCFFEPTLLLDVPLTARLMKEETFGPVAPLTRFKTERDAIAMGNDTEYGLACYFYSRDIGRIWRVAEGLEYGMVGINEGIISTEVAPFGGVKQSGIGREGSKYGIEEYLEIKYLCMGGL